MIPTNFKISYFGFKLDRKSTLHFFRRDAVAKIQNLAAVQIEKLQPLASMD